MNSRTSHTARFNTQQDIRMEPFLFLRPGGSSLWPAQSHRRRTECKRFTSESGSGCCGVSITSLVPLIIFCPKTSNTAAFPSTMPSSFYGDTLIASDTSTAARLPIRRAEPAIQMGTNDWLGPAAQQRLREARFNPVPFASISVRHYARNCEDRPWRSTCRLVFLFKRSLGKALNPATPSSPVGSAEQCTGRDYSLFASTYIDGAPRFGSKSVLFVSPHRC